MQIDRHSTELQKKQKGCLFMKHRVEANWCGLAHLSPLYEYFCWSLSATPPLAATSVNRLSAQFTSTTQLNSTVMTGGDSAMT